MTTDWSKTWAGANGWYDGYDSKKSGSFVDISKLSGKEKETALASAREGMIGVLEQKGVTRAQILDPTSDVGQFYNTQIKAVEKGGANAMRDALQATAAKKTSHVDRDASWGADDDKSVGRSYISAMEKDTSTGPASLNQISELYKKGFGREADAEGLMHWATSGASLATIAGHFAKSEEAKIRTSYADEYGRDIDNEGLAYWMGHTGTKDYEEDWEARKEERKKSGADDPDYWTKSKNWGDHGKSDYSGNVDAILKDTNTAETAIRQATWEKLGQASNEAQRGTMPEGLYTDTETEQVLDWVSKIQSGDMTKDQVLTLIADRGDRMDAHSKYDTDDAGKDPTGMGRFASLKDIEATIESGETPDDIRKRLAKEKWGVLTQEKDKIFGQHGTSEDLKRFAMKHHKGKWTGTTPGDDTTYTGQKDWTPTTLKKPEKPKGLDVDKSTIDYMPGVKADQFSSTPYTQAKTEFTAEQGKKQTPTTLATPDVMQRFTDTSAKGVSIKRSKAAKSNRSKSTKQLGREQQTQSLNI